MTAPEQIQNPWKFRKGVMVYDIETNFTKDWTPEGKMKKEVRCGVVYSFDEDEYFSYTDGDSLVKKISTADYLVTFNGEGFDHIVLKKHGLKVRKYTDRWKTIGIKSLDIMHEAQKRRIKANQDMKYPSLEDMSMMTLGRGKGKPDWDNQEQVLEYCKLDVALTKELYECKKWSFPTKRRPYPRRYKSSYDDDYLEALGTIWDGERHLPTGLMGHPILHGTEDGAVIGYTQCPLCEDEINSWLMGRIERRKDDEYVCPTCKGVILFNNDLSVSSVQTKEEYDLNVCSNCDKRFHESSEENYGYGAGSGMVYSGVRKCELCNEGCITWSRDAIPGFRDSWKSKCCKCGE